MDQNLALSPDFPSRLPKVGTTVFTIMSALAAKHQAINLGQGFPDFSCDRKLISEVHEAMLADHNQYPPMMGIAELRQGVSKKISTLYGHEYDPDTEITITAGGTQGIMTAILCCVSPGDEVVIIEPAYDSYRPSIDLAGGKTIAVSLTANRDDQGMVSSFSIPWDDLAKAINTKTRLVMINTPHNPTGMVWQASDLERLANLVKNTNALILSDEVYEHMVFDGHQHISIASHPELAARSFLISSFGKTYHVTGWKMGYVAAPAAMMKEFRKVHQFNVFTVNTPMQYGLAKYLKNADHYLGLPSFYQAKRDYFSQGLQQTKFKLLPAPASYFQCVNYTKLGIPQAKLSEADFCSWLTTEIGVAAIPVSAFYAKPVESGVIRFCFAKKEKTLSTALERLQTL
ncbi:aminotransferase class I/II-fold pyridoxal phosphate-dependent enzyme [Polynucleobacter sp. JS-Mosq-20-D10]|uniref:methionine aminotransferase n=1 Tax=Polynucleobacter sp. JS-Mosq-20-D10 TaxID=2576922 RepID=UPI001BFE8305|nr:methionine aminotransferase [Polynucleobacter sp. JS-Mosq-20-D10]QWD99588.1 aminotransferase class I/II-fold pyridoxal phosphate-dependent enzyme [Polynucleobacter sp. JS-Mosq-20-D10]